MERLFLTRSRAIEKIMVRRRVVSDALDDRHATDTDALRAELAELERMLLDVRAGRANEFVIHESVAQHCFVMPD
ncbi:hypothetical protein [Paraburkholderia rhizosphaerae]|uniref:FCD domain-containing protein n=1 Tax=Paraburkholderia rhizosphaerae TaxID=480658 RepID=A0A4V3HF53_9BURK|nr:hypothetical protein [Paraburkholderia rhizosphaerae]TDY51491.1 hypothetical protein BX592_10759 [Paraburkholderia rhizosphaerae]